MPMGKVTIKFVSKPKLSVGFVLARHFTMSAFSLFADTLRLASDEADRSGRVLCDWEVVSASPHLIHSSCGVQVSPTNRFGDPTRFHYIVVVGGLLNIGEPLDRQTMAFLKEAYAKGVRIIGACTGSFILAEAGFLEDRVACVSWLHYDEFKERFPDNRVTSHRLFVEDKGVITSAGGSAVADLAAFLVKRHVSVDAERNALEILQVDRRRAAHELQSRRPPVIAKQNNPTIRACILHMEQHIDDIVSIEELARTVGVSRRQLERLFREKADVSPGEAYLKIRMERARYFVERSNRELIDIALDVGFQNTSHFCRRFRQTFGLTPSQLRAQQSQAFSHSLAES